MALQSKTLFFEVRRFSDHGYQQVKITISDGYRETLSDAIGACEAGNRYGDADTNTEIAGYLRQLAAAGHVDIFDSYIDQTRAQIQWQVYEHEGETSYCRPRFEHLGSEFTAIERATKLLRKLAGRVETARARRYRKQGRLYGRRMVGNGSFESADDFIAALLAVGAVQVETVQLAQYRSFLVATGAVQLQEAV